MAQLDARKRRELRDGDFAYVDDRGRRRLPIHDVSHVRNALARFNQVLFEDERTRDQARSRLLRAAKRHGIVPIGFMEGQLRATGPRGLPSGQVTFLMGDIEDSTGHLHRLADGYTGLLADVRRLTRAAIRKGGGREVDARADEFLAVFRRTPAALHAALAIQAAMRANPWTDGADVRIRLGIHAGRPTLTDTGYVGLAVNTTARISALARGGQILMSQAAVRGLGDEVPPEASFTDLGVHRLRGLPHPETLFEAVTTGTL